MNEDERKKLLVRIIKKALKSSGFHRTWPNALAGSFGYQAEPDPDGPYVTVWYHALLNNYNQAAAKDYGQALQDVFRAALGESAAARYTPQLHCAQDYITKYFLKVGLPTENELKTLARAVKLRMTDR